MSRSRTTDAALATDNAAVYLLRRNGLVDEHHCRRKRRVGLDPRRRDRQRRRHADADNDTLSGNVRGSLLTDQGALDDCREHDHRRWVLRRRRLRLHRTRVQPTTGTAGPAPTRHERTGHNIDQDGHSCDLDAPGDVVGARSDARADRGQRRSHAHRGVAGGKPGARAIRATRTARDGQRGVSRANPCDIGAYEVAPSNPSPPSNPRRPRARRPPRSPPPPRR